jgi:hypothetical protein
MASAKMSGSCGILFHHDDPNSTMITKQSKVSVSLVFVVPS